MPPKTDIPVTDSANQLLQRNPLLYRWITNCFPISQIKSLVWAFDWLEPLQIELKKASSVTIKQGYKLLTEEFNSLLGQQHLTDENTQNDWASALLLKLLVMYVYRKNATECYPNQLIEFYQTMLWTKHADQVIATVPKAAYLHQLRQLVYKAIYKKPIDRTVDRALLRIQKHALNFYFKQFLDELGNTAQDRLRSDEEGSAYNHYTKMVGVLHVYIGEIDDSSLKEKETAHLSKLLLEQLTQLIETTSTLDLSPSWIERLKQWVQECISQLTSLYTTTPSAAKISYLQLLAISERLRKSTKKAARNKKLQSPELIREGCWLYFSLHEQLITQWVDKANMIDVILENCKFYEQKSMKGCNFRNTNLRRAIFKNCDISSSNFQRAILFQSEFYDCKAQGVNLKFANFTHVISRTQIMAQTILKNCNLKYASFEGVYLKGCDLSESIFINTDFTSAVLDECDFINAVLCSPILFQATIDKADLRNAEISGIDLKKFAFSGIKICEWQQTNLLEEYGIIVFPNSK